MESVKKNLINILLLILGGLFSSILLFFTQVILARELSPLQFGTFSAAIATITLIAPLSLFGLQHAWLKVYGEEGYSANRILKPSLKFIFFFSNFPTNSCSILYTLFDDGSLPSFTNVRQLN